MSQIPPDPEAGEMVLRGRIRVASNATFLATIDDLAVVYKPVAGERPLWDFPDGHLAYREVAAYLLSEATGWGIVPETWLGEGPYGPGMVQRWCEVDSGQEAVRIVPARRVPAGWHAILDGEDAAGHEVTLIHEESVPLRQMALFDVLVNNADRKGGHVLEMAGGHRYGIDHGVCLHHENKLRTVLWGWAGEPLSGEETSVVRRIRDGLEAGAGLSGELEPYLVSRDLDALAERCEALLAEARFPLPRAEARVIPWPPF